MEERRLVNQKTFLAWVGTILTIVLVIWGAMAYFVRSEDSKTRLNLQSQITVLQVQQRTSENVNTLVLAIDKKLSSIESSINAQSELIAEVKELRTEVNSLKVELAKVTR